MGWDTSFNQDKTVNEQRLADLKQAHERFGVVMTWLGNHKLPSEPICYTIAYEYLFTANVSLKKLVDAIDFEPDNCKQAFEKIYTECIIYRNYSSLTNSASVKPVVSSPLDTPPKEVKSSPENTPNQQDKTDEQETEENEYIELKQTASTDGLTDILDQQGLMLILNSAIKNKSNYPISILRFDLDRFKLFNATNGQKMGDAMLKHIARAFSTDLEVKDIVSRYEEDEFLILLPKTPIVKASTIAEQLRRRVEGISLKKKGDLKPVNVTTSIGISEYNGKIAFSDALENAKKALHRSKDMKGNCINREV